MHVMPTACMLLQVVTVAAVSALTSASACIGVATFDGIIRGLGISLTVTPAAYAVTSLVACSNPLLAMFAPFIMPVGTPLLRAPIHCLSCPGFEKSASSPSQSPLQQARCQPVLYRVFGSSPTACATHGGLLHSILLPLFQNISLCTQMLTVMHLPRLRLSPLLACCACCQLLQPPLWPFR